MYIVSIKMTKRKIVIGLVAVTVVFALVVGIISSNNSGDVQSALSFNVTAEDEEDRIQFLTQFGWNTSGEPVGVTEVIIPEVFDATYEEYNEIQKAQGFDLADYSGMRVKQWTYSVTNYPGGDGSEKATILIYEDKVIAGDISSGSDGGFMHGLKPGETTSDNISSQSQLSSESQSTT